MEPTARRLAAARDAATARGAAIAGSAAHGRALAAQLVMGVSGVAALGYQIVWTQQATRWLGHEAAAVLAVVTAFFGGLALGAWRLGPVIERSNRPERWYAGCEIVIALWSGVLALLLAPLSGWLLRSTGAQPTALWQALVAFGGTFLLLLPATAAMGATLPAMQRMLAGLFPDGQVVARLYACNTAGAVLGVLCMAFWWVPQIGLSASAGLCAALNGVCALASLVLGSPGQRQGSFGLAQPTTHPTTQPTTQPTTHPATRRHLLWLLGATGLLGIGYEVVVVRVLSQVTENTVYTFALLLAVYLVGTALGAAALAMVGASRTRARVQQSATAGPEPADGAVQATADLRRTQLLLCTLAASCLLGGLGLWLAPDLVAVLVPALGGSVSAALTAEAVLAVVAFALPTLVMGALFSHLSARALAAGIGWGQALAVNTLGAAAAPVVVGLVWLPLWGSKVALLSLVAGYLVLAWPWAGPFTSSAARPGPPPFSRSFATGARPWLVAGLAATLAAAAGWAPPLVFVTLPEGGRKVSVVEGPMATVSVLEDAAGVARLHINNRAQEGSSATAFVDARQALLPLLLHPGPQRALFLGLGTGSTASAAAADPALQVDAVELLPEVIQASAHFTRLREAAPDGADPPPNPRLQLLAADARRYVRSTERRYDLIVADNYHPARSGSGLLYTVEHFQAIQSRLTADGAFCQWLPLHQLDRDTLRSIVKSFQAVYPTAWAMLASNSLNTPVLALLAPARAQALDLKAVQQRLAKTTLPQRLADYGIGDEWALLGGFVAGPQALAQFAGDAPLNTDDRPIVSYLAPRITYAPDSLPRDRLLALLQELKLQPQELLGPNLDPSHAARLAAYWAARDLYLDSGRAVRPSADARAMLAQVGEPLLKVLRTSPDFRPAYDPLLRLAQALGRTDPVTSREWLAHLARLQPARPEATQALAASAR